METHADSDMCGVDWLESRREAVGGRAGEACLLQLFGAQKVVSSRCYVLDTVLLTVLEFGFALL